MHRAARIATETLISRQGRLDRDLGPLLAIAAVGLGVWFGLDLRAGGAAAVLDRLYFLALAAAAPLPIAALGALYHDGCHAPLLVWPVSGSAHLRVGARLLLVRHLPWALLVVGFALGAGWGAAERDRVLLLAFASSVYAGAWGAALGFAGLCAAASSSEQPLLRRLLRDLAGTFSSARHAPFFYLPAMAFAVSALSALLAEAGALRLLARRPGMGQSLLLLVAPLGVGAVAALIGARAYRGYALRSIPRVLEEARTIYGGRPAPVDPPYGASLARLLPGAVAPYYLKELREQSRAQRGLWALVLLAMLVAGAYAASVGEPLAAAPFAGALLVVWAASLPTRRGPQQAGAAYALTLPTARGDAWLGRFFALVFCGGHVTAAVGAALAYRHGRTTAIVVVALLLATAAAAVSATSLGSVSSSGEGLRRRWGTATRLVPAAGIAAAIVASRSLAGGLCVMAALVIIAVAARWVGADPLKARGAR